MRVGPVSWMLLALAPASALAQPAPPPAAPTAPAASAAAPPAAPPPLLAPGSQPQPAATPVAPAPTGAAPMVGFSLPPGYPPPPPGWTPPPGWVPPPWPPPPGMFPLPPGYALGPAPAAEPATKTVWYGWQTLVADGASLGAVLLGAVVANSSRDRDTQDSGGTLAGLGGLGYLLATPIVHWSHGHVGRGFASMGIRVGMPFLGLMLLASSLEGGRNNEAGAVLGVAILLASVPTAVTLDATVFGHEEVPTKTSWTPLLVPRRDGMTLGLGARFLGQRTRDRW